MTSAPALSDNNQTAGLLWSLIIAPPDIIPNPRPKIGMYYSEFAAMTRQTGYGDPVAVTQLNREMIYTLPRQNEVYFWFRDHRLSKMTKMIPDDQRSWIDNEISPFDSIIHPAF